MYGLGVSLNEINEEVIEFARSSTSEERYKLENNVIDMFNKIKI